jgi:hypothetical protein
MDLIGREDDLLGVLEGAEKVCNEGRRKLIIPERSSSMKKTRLINNLPLFLLVFSPLLCGADLSTYRGFQFGMGLNAAVKHSGMDISEVTLIHERPARIQELTWKPERFSGASRDTDPVEQVLFSFYNGQLLRIVVDYNHEKTEGLSVQDIIEAISATYCTAFRPVLEAFLPSASFIEGVRVVARWEDGDYSLDLVQSPYGSRFGLIALSKRLDGLAQAAIATGIHLDEQEAPRRQEAAEQNAQNKLDTTRLVNKPHFLP